MKNVVGLTVLCVALVHASIHPNEHPLPRPQAQARLLPLEKVPLRLKSRTDDVTIDGTNTTIGLATSYYLNGLLDDSWNIMGKIVDVLLKSGQEGEVDYFEVIRTQVQQVVGDYIDAHNMDQLEVYKDSLGVLLQRYMEAPVASSTYPDKNTVANSLSTSIISNRFLVEAGERPQSMIIHFADIASIHILVLKDVAETYSVDGVPSSWWVDLDDQLDHYINHGKTMQNAVVDWRNDMVTCSYDEGGKYEEWTITDPVAKLTDTCKQLPGTSSCDDHCQAYQVSMNREVSKFVWQYMGKSLREWEALRLLSSVMANKALGDAWQQTAHTMTPTGRVSLPTLFDSTVNHQPRTPVAGSQPPLLLVAICRQPTTFSSQEEWYQTSHWRSKWYTIHDHGYTSSFDQLFW